jgi:transglutaminase/protease-like cytokinesis protein 3
LDLKLSSSLGFANLFNEFCQIVNIECLVIEGYSKNFNFKIGNKISGENKHFWNVVKLYGNHYIVDSLNGSGIYFKNIFLTNYSN